VFLGRGSESYVASFCKQKIVVYKILHFTSKNYSRVLKFFVPRIKESSSYNFLLYGTVVSLMFVVDGM
jgi:hypothetical protein